MYSSVWSFEGGVIRSDVFEQTDFPELQADDVFEWVIEQIEQKRIRIDDFAGVRVENQNAVLRSLK